MTACNDLGETGDKGYITGDGIVSEVAVDERGDAVSFDGEDLDGNQMSIQDFRGKPVVVVVWGSWCTPCRKEAPQVVAAGQELGSDVQFLGINVRDPSTTNPQAFVRRFGVEYPSFFSPGGDALLAFHGKLTPRTIPSFLVLDADGRIAASIIGQLPSTQTLVDVTQGVVDETRDG